MRWHGGYTQLTTTHNTNKMAQYTPNATTTEAMAENVQFQFENLRGWLSVEDYESALIKALNLVDELRRIVNHIESDQIKTILNPHYNTTGRIDVETVIDTSVIRGHIDQAGEQGCPGVDGIVG